jgi:hypothetical protein
MYAGARPPKSCCVSARRPGNRVGSERVAEHGGRGGVVEVVREHRRRRGERIGLGVAVVEHRVDEHLAGQSDAGVAREDRDGRGDASAAAVAHDADTLRVDPKPGRALEQPRRSHTVAWVSDVRSAGDCFRLADAR